MDQNSVQQDDVQRVEVETETDEVRGGQAGGNGARGFTFRFGKAGAPGGFHSFFSGAPGDPDNPGAAGKPPVIAAWICLAAAWLFLGSSLPFTVFLGVPLAFIAMLLGAVCLSRGSVFTGFAVLALGSAGSIAVYLVGFFRLLFRFIAG